MQVFLAKSILHNVGLLDCIACIPFANILATFFNVIFNIAMGWKWLIPTLLLCNNFFTLLVKIKMVHVPLLLPFTENQYQQVGISN